MKYLSGSISIDHNNEKCIIRDELGPLINNFCLGTLTGLLETGKASYKFFEVHGRISLESVEEYTNISGDLISGILVPRNEFNSCAFDCASRYISFLHDLNDPRFTGDIELLEETKESTQKYLKEKDPLLIKPPC